MTRSQKISRGLTTHHARRGSLNAYRTGIYSRVVISEDVAAVVDLLFVAGEAWLDPRRDLPLAMLAAETLVRWSRAAVRLDSDSPTADALKVYTTASNRAVMTLQLLGFSPQAAANLGITKLEGWDRARRMTEAALAKYRPVSLAEASDAPDGSMLAPPDNAVGDES